MTCSGLVCNDCLQSIVEQGPSHTAHAKQLGHTSTMEAQQVELDILCMSGKLFANVMVENTLPGLLLRRQLERMLPQDCQVKSLLLPNQHVLGNSDTLWACGIASGQAILHVVITAATLAELKMAGHTAADLRSRGYSAARLRGIGFPPKELLAGGYELADLRSAGCMAVDIVAELRLAGCPAEEMWKAGCTVVALRKAGYKPHELRLAGFTLSDLKAAGFTAAHLEHAGCIISELIGAGFTAADGLSC